MNNMRILQRPKNEHPHFRFVRDENDTNFHLYMCVFGARNHIFRTPEQQEATGGQGWIKIWLANKQVEEVIRSIDWVNEVLEDCTAVYSLSEWQMIEIYEKHIEEHQINVLVEDGLVLSGEH